MLTNNVDPAPLTIGRMFAKNASGSGSPTLKKVYPSRDGNASARLLDLTTFYNARLTETWHGTANATGNDLAALPAGVQNIGGVEYDLRGVIQLGGKAPTPNQFPSSVLGIKVNQKCQKLHFLHSAAWGHVQDEGKQIGTYVLHFASNNMRLDVPIVYGKDVRDWHYWPEEEDAPASLHMVWKGENTVSRAAGSYVRLFETTWINPVPDMELESLDFVSSMSQPAPFLVAITLE